MSQSDSRTALVHTVRTLLYLLALVPLALLMCVVSTLVLAVFSPFIAYDRIFRARAYYRNRT